MEKDENREPQEDDEGTEDLWYMGDTPLSPAGLFALVGWPEVFPSYPPTPPPIWWRRWGG